MSSTPAFETGFWNAWLLIIPLLSIFIIVRVIIIRNRNGSEIARLKKEKLLYALTATVFASYVHSIFLPLKLGTAWFCIGFVIYLLGLIFAIMATLNFATTSNDKPVTKGVYGISRNPMYFGAFLIYVGIGVACASWIYLLLATAYIILQHTSVISEERFCLQKYGNEYREYMDKTPKWIGIPKSRKK